jgi:hypothetical protein
VLKLSSNVSDVFPKVLKLSFEVSECKSLIVGNGGRLRYETRGAAIDAADVVLRFNNGRTRGQGLTLVHFPAQPEP